MNPWTPELEVTPALATRLIEAQFPSLKPVRIAHLGSGWDNVVYCVNDEYYFRFPQRQMAVDGVLREMAALPVLAEWLKEIPRIEFAGAPSADYAWPFFGYRPVLGEEIAKVSLTSRKELATSVATFLRKLHGREVFARFANTLPEDPLGRLNFHKRVPMSEERLDKLEKLGIDLPQAKLRKILRDALAIAKPSCAAVVHGDLHFRHIITSPAGDLRGIIDWGDLHLNDPTTDLQLYWSFFAGEDRQRFLKIYGRMSESQLIQARSFAAFLSIAILTAALDQKQDFLVQEALRSIENILQDEVIS